MSILQGDSGDLLPTVLDDLLEPALFWLDGHFSGGVTALGARQTPIEQELSSILDPTRPEHVVLIDDLRLFDGTNGYPTVEQLRSIVREQRPGWHLEVVDDIASIGLAAH